MVFWRRDIVGKKRAVSVKRLAEMLLKIDSQGFTVDFETNKKLVDEMMKNSSKKRRNEVAGFITSNINKESLDQSRISRLVSVSDSNQRRGRRGFRRER
jgi:small subunit ribosomal protein S17e